MNVKKLTFLLIFFAQQASGQLHLQFQWGSDIIQLEKVYKLGDDSIYFDELKMYVSDFHFQKQNRQHHILETHLIDLADQQSLTLFPDFPVKDYETISFQFGMDSSYHVSQSVEGDLDPLKGMYWAWNSGYIQFKCTGKCTRIPLEDQSFEFHLGGYRKPHETRIPMLLVIQGDTVILDMKPFFEQVAHLEVVQRIMIPSPLAKSYCQFIARNFFTK
ncbi:MAG: hypothetical protein RLZZ243_1227 [Bacteroidota bacterium]|jgi:hypothetical protein